MHIKLYNCAIHITILVPMYFGGLNSKKLYLRGHKIYASMPNAIISAVSGYVPDQVLSNYDLEKIMETSHDWIITRTGISERRVMPDREAVTSIGVHIVEDLLRKSGYAKEDIELVICATCTSDYILPDSANSICYHSGLSRAYGFDLNAACSGFVYALYTGAQFIQTGAYRKIIVIGAEKLTSFMNYEDRATSILFGDGGGGVILEGSDEELGIIDAVLKGDGEGCDFLKIPAGGSLNPVDQKRLENRENFVIQEGKAVFRRAVNGMADTIVEVLEKTGVRSEELKWIVPHQANKRIISAVANKLNFPMERVMLNIEKYGNTSAGTIPLCLWEYESQMSKGDYIMLTAFGGGFTWGSLLLKWAY